MLPGFLLRRESEVSQLSELLNGHDYKGIKDIAHRLKGIGGGYGLQVITDLGGELERAAAVEDDAKAAECIQHLANVVRHLKIAIHIE